MSDMSGTFVADAGAQVQTILVVDDNPVNLGVVGEHLEDNNYNVTVAQDGMEGLKRAELGQPDLILLDVMMPGIDGFETCRRLKANPLTAEIPVIFMTALTDVNDKVSAFQAGGVDYISKPFQTEEMLARLRTHLSLRNAQRNLAARNARLEMEMAARHIAEVNLKRSEVSYRRLFETAPDGLMLVDAQSGEVFDANPAAMDMFSHDPADVLGKTIWELAASARMTFGEAMLRESMRLGMVKYDDWELTAASGVVTHAEVIARTYETDQRQVVLFNFRNINDRKEAEARIRSIWRCMMR